jgi:hypothetical protein
MLMVIPPLSITLSLAQFWDNYTPFMVSGHVTQVTNLQISGLRKRFAGKRSFVKTLTRNLPSNREAFRRSRRQKRLHASPPEAVDALTLGRSAIYYEQAVVFSWVKAAGPGLCPLYTLIS